MPFFLYPYRPLALNLVVWGACFPGEGVLLNAWGGSPVGLSRPELAVQMALF